MITFLAVALAWWSLQSFLFFSPACASCGISLDPLQYYSTSADGASEDVMRLCQETLLFWPLWRDAFSLVCKRAVFFFLCCNCLFCRILVCANLWANETCRFNPLILNFTSYIYAGICISHKLFILNGCSEFTALILTFKQTTRLFIKWILISDTNHK